ncbi:MAG: ATP synthase subunit C [Spirochaetes bacterium]|nr:ATP synthase subunit C [Spirochaetota bacterium]
MKKWIIIIFLFNFTFFMSTALFASNETAQSTENQIEKSDSSAKLAKYFAAAIAIGAATLSSGIAIGRIGSAAMGAISERPEAGGPALILAALAEGVSLWGFLIAFFILNS